MVLAIGLSWMTPSSFLKRFPPRRNGMRPFQAAITGTREIAFAVVAMTLTLTAVYAPIAFATGRTGRLFLEFALALAGAVLVSGFVALTLTPMLCSKLLRHDESPGWIFTAIERGLRSLEGGYRRALRAALSVRWLIVILGLATAGVAAVLFVNLKSELVLLRPRCHHDPRQRAGRLDTVVHGPLQRPGRCHPGRIAGGPLAPGHQRSLAGHQLHGHWPSPRLVGA